MTPDRANDLASRIARTWPTNKIDVLDWAEVLIDLDEAAATTAFVRLRRTEDKPPTIAGFCRAVDAVDHRPVGHREPCVVCDGTGWVQVKQTELGNPDAYSAVAPCEFCEAGKTAAGPFRTYAQVGAA